MPPPMRTTALLSALSLAFGTRAPAQEESPPAEGRCFLWKVAAGEGLVYVLGSLDLAKKDLYPLDPAIMNAFEESPILAVEIDVTDRETIAKIQRALLLEGRYDDGTTLEKHLSPETFRDFRTRLGDLGVAYDTLKRNKIWFAGTMLVVSTLEESGYSSEHGMDRFFLNRAKDKKEIRSLETVDDQVAAACSGNEEVHALSLRITLDEYDDLKPGFDGLVKAWTTGDISGVEDWVYRKLKKEPRLKPLLDSLTDRNRKMAARIAEALEKGEKLFVVVGAGHLVGEAGILRQLQQRGCTVGQISQASGKEPPPGGADR